MPHLSDLEKLIEKTRMTAANARDKLEPKFLPSDASDAYLNGILQALGIIGKILAEKK